MTTALLGGALSGMVNVNMIMLYEFIDEHGRAHSATHGVTLFFLFLSAEGRVDITDEFEAFATTCVKDVESLFF